MIGQALPTITDAIIIARTMTPAIRRWDWQAGCGVVEAHREMKSACGLLWSVGPDDAPPVFAKSWRELVALQTAEMAVPS